MRKAKLGLSALLLIGIIYTALGGLFVAVGIVAGIAGGKDAWLLSLIFCGVGGLFLILGIVFLAIQIRKQQRANRLLENGRFLWAEIIDCVPNYNVRINGVHPYILIARYMDGQGTAHLFKSGNLRVYADPAFLGKTVKVYYEDETYRHYYVDTEGIQKNIVEH